eukprot:Sspe_Gene.70380::Locus_41561_Transcript_1_1_Confidence_1.000_Length_846::g.70380::m.70380
MVGLTPKARSPSPARSPSAGRKDYPDALAMCKAAAAEANEERSEERRRSMRSIMLAVVLITIVGMFLRKTLRTKEAPDPAPVPQPVPAPAGRPMKTLGDIPLPPTTPPGAKAGDDSKNRSAPATPDSVEAKSEGGGKAPGTGAAAEGGKGGADTGAGQAGSPSTAVKP